MVAGTLAELLAVLGVDLTPLDRGLAEAEVKMDATTMKMAASVQNINDAFTVLQRSLPAGSEGVLNQLLGTRDDRSGSAATKIMDVVAALQVLNEEKLKSARISSQAEAITAGGPMAGASSGLGARGTYAGLEFALSGSNFALGKLLSTLPQVQSLVGMAFDGLVVLGFLDILYKVGAELVNITDEANGWGKANRQSWDDAYKGALASRLELARYNEEMGKAKTANIKDPDERAKAQAAVTGKTIAELERDRKSMAQDQGLHHMQDLAQQLKELQEPGMLEGLATPGRLANILAVRQQISKEYGSVEDMQKRINDASATEVAIAKELSRLRIEQVREEARGDRPESSRSTHRKFRDPVHEYPHLLPWFMGRRMSDDFPGSGAGPGIAHNLPPDIHGMSSISMPAISQMKSAPGGKIRSAGASGGVTFSPVYSPVFHFEGMPADIQAFVRDKMEPQLVKDMDSNARGIAKQMEAALRKAGR